MESKDIKLNTYFENTFYVYGEFDDTILDNILIPLRKEIDIQKTKKEGRINIRINSVGGYANFLYPLINLIEYAKKEGVIVATYVDNMAYSCGSLLAVTGTKGERYINTYSQHLLHLGAIPKHWVSTDLQADRFHDYTKQHFNTVRSIYKKYAKVPDLNQKLKDDYYFVYGEDIIKFELADKYEDSNGN